MDTRTRVRPPLAMGEIRMGFLRAVPGLLRERGHDPTQVLARFGLAPAQFDDIGAVIPLAQAGALVEECARITACPHFGLLVGERFEPAVFGETARLMLESGTVEAALRTFVLRHHLLDAGAVTMLLPAGETRTALAYSIYAGLPAGLDHLYDAAMAIGMGIMRALCGRGWQPLAVRLPRRAPEDAARYRRCFGQNIAFNAGVASLTFATSWLRTRVTHDPVLDERLRLAAAGTDTIPALPLAHLVTRALRAMVFTGTATQPNVARLFSMHPRTLSRQLRAESASFQDLLRHARMGVAQQLLRETNLRASDIAATLHYGEPAAFTKAFRAHTGLSPSAWRAQDHA